MTTYDERERAFEAAFAHDEELRFKAHARRDRKLGLWAAGLMGRSGEAAEAYANDVVAAGIMMAGDEALATKLEADFSAAAVAQTAEQIHAALDRLLAEALAEMKAGA